MKKTISIIKKIILRHDQAVAASNGILMGSKGILFNESKKLKYAIIPTSKGITVHSIPMYCNKSLHSKYKKRFIDAIFGKGCIRFKLNQEIDVVLLSLFIRDCAKK